MIPFVTGWVGENHFDERPMAFYGAVLLMAAIAYFFLQDRILAIQGKNSLLAKALGNDLKGKASPIIYIVAIIASFYNPWIAGALYIMGALIWLIPDKRIEIIFRDKE